jgi:hypothetical protein
MAKARKPVASERERELAAGLTTKRCENTGSSGCTQ